MAIKARINRIIEDYALHKLNGYTSQKMAVLRIMAETPRDTFLYARCEVAIAFLEFKSEIALAFIERE